MAEEKKSSTLKTVMIVLGVLAFVGMGTCGACAMCGVATVGTAVNEVVKQEEAKKVAIKQQLKNCQDTEVSKWRDIAAELEKNEAKVAKMWKGNCVKVSGVVTSIDSDFQDEPVVSIGSGKQFELKTCRCSPVDKDKALNLTKGQKITVWGIGGSEFVGSLMLDHCQW